MANDNNIKNFTAYYIEKYHKGQLSPKEMHDLEKAALDDPFLADALEGYSTEGINISSDIAELKKRLAGKSEQAKVIPIRAGGRSSFPWLRAAVMIVLIAGAGLLAYQFLFNNKSGNIAQVNPNENQITKTADSINTLPRQINDDTSSGNGIKSSTAFDNATKPENGRKEQKTVTGEATGNSKVAEDSVTVSPGVTATNAPTTSAPVKLAEEKAEYKKLSEITKQRDDAATGKADVVAKNENKAKDLALNKKPADKDADGVVDMQDKANEVVVSAYGIKRSENLNRNTNFFRGRVTDANNNALPFANITNTVDNVGTYSDAKGNFTLISPDTVLNVQVRSLGFENNNVQLRNQVSGNQVMLQEDRSLNARILDTVKRNISRSRNNTMTFEEPEPADGWDSYGSYLVNNLNIPETFDIKKSGETAENTVEVSFEVNKNGDPVNLKVEKSLCDKCDKEAIRLIKDGPKWKRKAKKGKRTTVAVPFIKAD